MSLSDQLTLTTSRRGPTIQFPAEKSSHQRPHSLGKLQITPIICNYNRELGFHAHFAKGFFRYRDIYIGRTNLLTMLFFFYFFWILSGISSLKLAVQVSSSDACVLAVQVRGLTSMNVRNSKQIHAKKKPERFPSQGSHHVHWFQVNK